ncbi:bifunctional [glutamate--ammonia ligase]-adenylyl-L-tyrosine phosphorylase/[glutamate--ammonia-ligase] adenylyltransferase [Deferrisoma camini]|uniref:bifunctional [glutamate--ammonia ligase]-adenylyl-L-tyrosine phosphorylase/[glutamate--ammonia-ligase] adenylyltransferase n=1 Tax=Deferrisoma camini TaxID=1035120 RepID=UPI0004BCEA15|nr:bifunctional [glutamate--ammonia ligase]-adenylyl-L-tyrosine phosphorylase/[glutamate--ammonia-ligase] adenylyltransferase [Deferrisoma camini]
MSFPDPAPARPVVPANARWAAQARDVLERAGLRVDAWPAAPRTALDAAVGASPEVARWLARTPALAERLLEEDLGKVLGVDDYRRRLRPRLGTTPHPEVELRRARAREMLRIVAREAAGLAPVEETAGEVSAFAEAAVEAALERAWVEAGGAEGPPSSVVVLGMGKLGGRELNLSSDVDLVFLYDGRETRGGESAEAFFTRVVGRVVELLGRVTPEGWVFRVDLGLRPEGRSGAAAHSVENAVLYYQSWGQTWERAALMRARPVAGNRALGEAFLREVEPFVYRRSLDYTTVEDLKEMKARIDQSAARRFGGQQDLKLGRGGIREVEFFVQTFQLIHGGRTPAVRTANTLEALARLAGAGVISAETATRLGGCYRFLRSLEHAVQALRFRQTHRLPSSHEELETVARRMGFGGEEPVAALMEALEEVRTEVHGEYGRLMHGADREWGGSDDAEARALLGLTGREEALPRLQAAGFRNPTRAWEGLERLRGTGAKAPPSPRSRRILGRIGPRLLGEVRRCPDPDRALEYLAEFLAGSGARSSYLALLEENPATARLLVQLFGTSQFLSRYLVSHPELLDELVLGPGAATELSLEELSAELDEALAGQEDDEAVLDVLRRFRNAQFLRIALHDLWGGLAPEQVTRQITRVAEACLGAALAHAESRLRERHGEPRLPDGRPARFAVLGMGKLGGEEIDYHSDLDVIFVYEGAGETTGGAGRALGNAEYFARVAQRLISALATRTREGVAFRMDARLRPSGNAGPLVASLEAFAAYHREQSQTWERQALIRLRPVAGDGVLGQRVRAVADEVLYGGPPVQDPRPEIAAMRERIEREVAREERGRLDLKAGPGGLVDVEFGVQALQLLHGWRIEAARSPATLTALGALRAGGALGGADGSIWEEGYRYLRRVEARLRILSERPTDVLPSSPERMAELARGLGYPDPRSLEREVAEWRTRIRGVYERVMGADG